MSYADPGNHALSPIFKLMTCLLKLSLEGAWKVVEDGDVILKVVETLKSVASLQGIDDGGYECLVDQCLVDDIASIFCFIFTLFEHCNSQEAYTIVENKVIDVRNPYLGLGNHIPRRSLLPNQLQLIASLFRDGEFIQNLILNPENLCKGEISAVILGFCWESEHASKVLLVACVQTLASGLLGVDSVLVLGKQVLQMLDSLDDNLTSSRQSQLLQLLNATRLETLFSQTFHVRLVSWIFYLHFNNQASFHTSLRNNDMVRETLQSLQEEARARLHACDANTTMHDLCVLVVSAIDRID